MMTAQWMHFVLKLLSRNGHQQGSGGFRASGLQHNQCYSAIALSPYGRYDSCFSNQSVPFALTDCMALN